MFILTTLKDGPTFDLYQPLCPLYTGSGYKAICKSPVDARIQRECLFHRNMSF